MRKKIGAGVIIQLLLVSIAFGSLKTNIVYTTNEIIEGRWEYNYEVINLDLEVPIEQFSIWFDYGLYEDIVIETSEPLSLEWDEIVIQPEPVIGDDGLYDALALVAGIEIGEKVSGFKVSFNWLGEDEPGSQFYEIVDPVTFETIDSGNTIPEPLTVILLGFGALAMHRRQRRG
jgi:hypothetical protein